ncbi:MAG: hypothetical protein JST00_20665 [Deltaproteobacteria bacterium]|nr:hypothetical protein [Deltaproteobacteria bacterium]
MSCLFRRALGIAVATSLFASACKNPPPPPTKIAVRVTTTRGAPVEGAEIVLGATVLARSDARGAATVDVAGREGDSFELETRCPAPLKAPKAPLVVRRLTIGGGDVEHAVRCEETRRTLAIVVRAEGGPDLPILYLGKEIGRTDASGAAHVKLELDVRDRVELTLDTHAESMADAHPKNPSFVFEPAESDEVKELAVTFTRDAKRKPSRTAPKGPILIR